MRDIGGRPRTRGVDSPNCSAPGRTPGPLPWRPRSPRRGVPRRATVVAHGLAGTPVSVCNASGAISSRRALTTLSSTSGGVSLARRRGEQPLSDIGSPRLARPSHLCAVCRLTPAIAAASKTVTPERTLETRDTSPRGQPCAGMLGHGRPLLAENLDNSEFGVGLPICHYLGVSNLLALNSQGARRRLHRLA